VDEYSSWTSRFACSFHVKRLRANKLNSSLSSELTRRMKCFQSCCGGVLTVERCNAVGQAAEPRYRNDDLIARIEVDGWTATNADAGRL
jgi:hypothetical protein